MTIQTFDQKKFFVSLPKNTDKEKEKKKNLKGIAKLFVFCNKNSGTALTTLISLRNPLSAIYHNFYEKSEDENLKLCF